MPSAPTVLCIGEVMIELSGIRPDGAARLGFGGDTGNTAIYLSRLLGADRVGYLTRLGADPFGETLAHDLRTEGLTLAPDCMTEGRQTGLYAITLDDAGERSFTYWRAAAPARDLLSGDLGVRELAWAQSYDALYISGITLAVLHETGLAQALDLMTAFRNAGKTVMFDTNLRPALWATNHPDADLGKIYADAASRASIVKTGRDELDALFGEGAPVSRLGTMEVIVTDGGGDVVVLEQGQTAHVPVSAASEVIDATAAGDSFNAGYLAAKLAGAAPTEAVKAGHNLASAVIGHHGAIIPVQDMPG